MGDTIRYPNMGTVKQAAEIYGLSPHYIRRLCKTGKVRYVNAGRGWLVNLDSLARYFEQGDPAPAEQSQTAHGVRQIGLWTHPGAHRERTPRPAARCNTLDFHGKSCALAEGLALASRADVYTNVALASNGPVHTRPLALQGLVGKNPKPT